MSFRTRVTVAASLAVLVAVLATSLSVYVLVRRDLREQIDESLRRTSEEMTRAPLAATRLAVHNAHRVDDRYVEYTDADGDSLSASHAPRLATPDEVLSARGEADRAFYDADLDGTPFRVLATPLPDGGVLKLGRSLEEVNETLHRLALILAGLATTGLGIAIVIGRAVAAAAVKPVQRLSFAAEAIASTGDLSHSIPVAGGDELGALATNFNAMLRALDTSLAQQRQLVADAAHELSTPLASVRTNVEVLRRVDELEPWERHQLIDDVVAQTAELTRLVSDLVELARGDGDEHETAEIDLGQIAEEVVAAAQRSYPNIVFRLRTRPSRVVGSSRRVARAVANLVDNAAKWSPPGGTVTIDAGDATVTVQDAGPGIAAEDLPHIFDRFYRSAASRSLPGSGLGLAIVKQVADAHGGRVEASAGPDGVGTRLALHLRRAAGETDASLVWQGELPTPR